MGICVKNNPQTIQQQRIQIDLTNNHRHISNLSAPKPKPQKITIQIINKKEPLQPPEEIDMSEPQPQQGLSEYFYQVNPQQDENEDEINIQIEKLSTLRRLSSNGLRQSNNDQICGICYQRYQIFRKWPMQICINQHIICDQCFKDFQKLSPNEPFPCPFCRLLIFDFEVKPCKKIFKTLKKVDYKTQQNSQQIDFCIFAFQHELYQIASAYKQNRRKDIKRLQHLQFQNKLIEKFPYFSYFKNVLFLQLQNNNISDCLFLLPLSNTLKILNISNNQIKSLDWISQFSRLQILACQNNKIRHITYYTNLLALKELYLSRYIENIVGNVLDDKETIQTFKTVYFQNLKILSIESEGNQIENYLTSQFDLRLNKFQSKNVQQNQKKKEIEQRQNIFDNKYSSLLAFIVTLREQTKKRQVKIIQRKSFIRSFQKFKLQQAISAHLYDYYFYGNLVQFIPDGKNSHYRQYRFKDNKLLKLSSNFTALNSKYWIPHQAKQTLKMKMRQKNSNVMIGICTRSIKYSASVYSDEFIGITFWGNIYNKAESIPIKCDLRISDGSIIAMILDFDKGEISWYIDKRLIGKLTNQLYFLKSKELYFIYGVRDSQIEVQFII